MFVRLSWSCPAEGGDGAREGCVTLRGAEGMGAEATREDTVMQ